jgi:hypothetical protein
MKLEDLGFSRGCIVETIASTYGSNQAPNAAPMGATMQDEATIALKLFNSSLTFQNLQLKRAVVLNITNDISLFYKTTFKEVNPSGKLSLDIFEESKFVEAPKLKAAEGIIHLTVKDLSAIDHQRTSALCEVRSIDALQKPTKAYSRAHSATIEALIHSTRIKLFIRDEKRRELVKSLITMFGECKEIVNKTAPVSIYAEIISDLEKRIETWRDQL